MEYLSLLGTPLSHSFSVRIQNRAYSEMKEDLRYILTETDICGLKGEIDKIRCGAYRGFALTMPCKTEVIKYLDEIDDFCQKIGAVNTVVKSRDTGRLKGYNTDGMGFYRSITEEGRIDVSKASFFVMGCGGAGRAIASILAYKHAKRICLMDRHEDRMNRLAEDLCKNFATMVDISGMTGYNILIDYDVIINATGAGMGKNVGKSPVRCEDIPPGKLCYDACYNPPKTRFMRDAESRDSRTLNGLGMLIYQGAEQIRLWTGRDAPIEAMRDEAMQIINESTNSM